MDDLTEAPASPAVAENPLSEDLFKVPSISNLKVDAAQTFGDSVLKGFRHDSFMGNAWQAGRYATMRLSSYALNEPKISKAEFDREYGWSGIKWEEGMGYAEAQARVLDRLDMETSEKNLRAGAHNTVASFTGSLVGTFAADLPVNMAMNKWIPTNNLVMQAHEATVSATPAYRFTSRVINEALDGALQSVPQNTFQLLTQGWTQNEMSLQEAAMNTAAATAFGLGIGFFGGTRRAVSPTQKDTISDALRSGKFKMMSEVFSKAKDAYKNADGALGMEFRDTHIVHPNELDYAIEWLKTNAANPTEVEVNGRAIARLEALKEKYTNQTVSRAEYLKAAYGAEITDKGLLDKLHKYEVEQAIKITRSYSQEVVKRRMAAYAEVDARSRSVEEIRQAGEKVTNDESFLSDLMDKAFGVRVRFVDKDVIDPHGYLGFAHPADPTQIIVRRGSLFDTDKAMMTIAGHEVAHTIRLRDPDMWTKIVETIIRDREINDVLLAESNKRKGDAQRASRNTLLFKAWTTYKDATESKLSVGVGKPEVGPDGKVRKAAYTYSEMDEVFANSFGHILTDENFWAALNGEDSTMASKLLTRMQLALDKLLHTKDGAPTERAESQKNWVALATNLADIVEKGRAALGEKDKTLARSLRLIYDDYEPTYSNLVKIFSRERAFTERMLDKRLSDTLDWLTPGNLYTLDDSGSTSPFNKNQYVAYRRILPKDLKRGLNKPMDAFLWMVGETYKNYAKKLIKKANGLGPYDPIREEMLHKLDISKLEAREREFIEVYRAYATVQKGNDAHYKQTGHSIWGSSAAKYERVNMLFRLGPPLHVKVVYDTKKVVPKGKDPEILYVDVYKHVNGFPGLDEEFERVLADHVALVPDFKLMYKDEVPVSKQALRAGHIAPDEIVRNWLDELTDDDATASFHHMFLNAIADIDALVRAENERLKEQLPGDPANDAGYIPEFDPERAMNLFTEELAKYAKDSAEDIKALLIDGEGGIKEENLVHIWDQYLEKLKDTAEKFLYENDAKYGLSEDFALATAIEKASDRLLDRIRGTATDAVSRGSRESTRADLAEGMRKTLAELSKGRKVPVTENLLTDPEIIWKLQVTQEIAQKGAVETCYEQAFKAQREELISQLFEIMEMRPFDYEDLPKGAAAHRLASIVDLAKGHEEFKKLIKQDAEVSALVDDYAHLLVMEKGVFNVSDYTKHFKLDPRWTSEIKPRGRGPEFLLDGAKGYEKGQSILDHFRGSPLAEDAINEPLGMRAPNIQTMQGAYGRAKARLDAEHMELGSLVKTADEKLIMSVFEEHLDDIKEQLALVKDTEDPSSGPIEATLKEWKARFEQITAKMDAKFVVKDYDMGRKILQTKGPQELAKFPPVKALMAKLGIQDPRTALDHVLKDAKKDTANRLYRKADGLNRAYQHWKTINLEENGLARFHSSIDGSPRKGVPTPGNNLESNVHAAQNKDAAVLHAFMYEHNLLGVLDDHTAGKGFMLKVAQHLDNPGAKADPVVVEFADVINKLQELQVARLNLHYADITPRKDFLIHQKHNVGRIENDKANWIKFMIDNADWKQMEAESTAPGSLANRAQYLNAVFDWLSRPDDTPDPRTQYGNMVTSESKHRVIHFKTLEAAVEYDSRYGSGAPLSQVFEQVMHRAKISELAAFIGLDYKENFRLLGLKTALDGKGTPNLSMMWDAQKSADIAFREVSEQLNRPVDDNLARWGQSIRNLARSATLMTSAISSLPDIGNAMSMLRMTGANVGYGKFVRTMAAIASDSDRKATLAGYGAGLDAILASFSRNEGQGFHKLSASLADFTMKWSGLDLWGRTMQGAYLDLQVRHLSEVLSTGSITPEIRNWLDFVGLSQQDFRRLSKYVTRVEGFDSPVIHPDLIMDDPALAKRFRAALDYSVRQAMLEPNSTIRGSVHLATQAGTPMGEAVRTLGMYKTYPFAMNAQVVRRIHNWQGGPMGKEKLLWASSLIGLAITALSIKDMLRGREPLNPFDTEQWTITNASRITLQAGIGPFSAIESIYGNLLGPVFGSAAQIASGAIKGDSYSVLKGTLGMTPVVGSMPVANELAKEIASQLSADIMRQRQLGLMFLEQDRGQTSIFLNDPVKQ